MDAARLFSIARRWWWLILVGTLMSTAAYGFAERIRQDTDDPAFNASASVFVSLYNSQATADEVAARTGGESWTLDRLIASYVTIIEGHAVAQAVANSFAIDVTPDDLRSSIDARPVPGSQLIRITTTGATPQDAEALRDATLRAFTVVSGTAGIPGASYTYELTPPVLADGSTQSDAIALAAVILAGMLSAAAIIFAFEYFSDAIRDARDAEVLTGLPVLATVPVWRARDRVAFDQRDRASTHAAERYRLMRSSLNRLHGDNQEIVVITGTLAGAGATTTAINYAAALARSGRRTLLIDANLRDPALDRAFDRPAATGLSFALRDGALGDLATSTPIDNLSVAHAGTPTYDAAELVESTTFAGFVAGMRARFDAIVIDCPPALTATETLALATLADATVVVVRADRTARSETAAAVEMLRRAGANVAGIILNADPATGPALFARSPFTRARPAVAHVEHASEASA
jgi:receptor protein-tyrosine kinase